MNKKKMLSLLSVILIIMATVTSCGLPVKQTDTTTKIIALVESTAIQSSTIEITDTTSTTMLTTSASTTIATTVATTTQMPTTVVTTTQKPTTVETTSTTEETTTSEEMKSDYVLNTNTMKFHYPSCGSAAKINPENREDVNDTRENIIAEGYSPCGNCDP